MAALEAQIHADEEDVYIDALVDNLWLEVEAEARAKAQAELEAESEAEDHEDVLLESSDVIEVQAARTGAGLELLVEQEHEQELGENDELEHQDPADSALTNQDLAHPVPQWFDADAHREPESGFEAEPGFEAESGFEAEPGFEPDSELEPTDESYTPEPSAEFVEPTGLELCEEEEGQEEAEAEAEADEPELSGIRFRLDQFIRPPSDPSDERDAEQAEADDVDAIEIEIESIDTEAAEFLAQVAAAHEYEEQACAPELEVAANVDPLRVPAWSKVNTSGYAFVRGLRGMAQSPLVQLLAVGTMAVCMLLLGTTMLIFQNATRVAHDLGVDSPVTVYMEPGTDARAAMQLRERIAALPEVESAERVSSEQALTRLQEGLGTGSTSNVERGALLTGIDASTLPESVEVALVPGVEPGFADALAVRVQSMQGVEEVSVLGPWVQEVERMLSTLRWLAFGIGALVSLACLAIVWSTIRLGVFARRSEIQILRLVGGTHRFVRGPFVVEGVVQGVLGTALALAGLWLVFELTQPFLERGMSLLFAAGSLHFFSLVELALALCFGAMLGLIGSRAAVARHAQG